MGDLTKQPNSRLSLRWLNLKRKLRLFGKSLFRQNFWRDVHADTLMSSGVATLLDVDIRKTPPSELTHLDLTGMSMWRTEQIDGLGTHQIPLLLPEQLKVLVRSDQITHDQLAFFVKSLSARKSANKVSIMVQALEGDPREDEKLQEIVLSIEHVLTDQEARDVLSAMALELSDSQLAKMLDYLSSSFLFELVKGELDRPSPQEKETLALKIEERKMANAQKVVGLKHDWDLLDRDAEALITGPSTVLDFRLSPWRRVCREKLNILQSYLLTTDRTEKERARAFKLIQDMIADLKQLAFHYEVENAHIATLQERWNEDFWSYFEKQAQFLKKILEPQSQVLKEMTSLLVARTQKPLAAHEKTTLMETIQKGLALAKVLRPQTEAPLMELEKLKIDLRFFNETKKFLIDSIRNETGLGRFSAIFFFRLMNMPASDTTFYSLHNERIEELLANYPIFSKAIDLMEQIVRVIQKLQGYIDIFHERLNKIRVHDDEVKLQNILEVLNTSESQVWGGACLIDKGRADEGGELPPGQPERESRFDHNRES